MAPKRKSGGKKRKPAKSTAKKSSKKKVQKKEKRSKGGKGKRARAAKAPRAKSAYQLFCADRRAELARGQGGGDKFGDVARLLAQAWHDLGAEEKATFEARAGLEKHSNFLEAMQPSAHAESVAVALGHCIATVAEAPRGAADAVERAINAMDALDLRLSASARAAMVLRLGSGPGGDQATVEAVRRAHGSAVGSRLGALLRRWRGAVGAGAAKSRGAASAASSAAPSRPRADASEAARGSSPSARARSRAGRHEAAQGSSPAEKKRKRDATSKASKEVPTQSAAPVVETFQQIRSKVVGLLMRTVAKAVGHVNFALCRRIEEALFEACGQDPKEYKRRARSLSFNLGAPDGALLGRVMRDEVPLAELVRLDAEDLASDVLKAERLEERERYFRSEVHDVVGPPKRKRDLFNAGVIPVSKAGLAEEPEDTQASQPQASQEAEDDDLPPGPGGGASGGMWSMPRRPAASTGDLNAEAEDEEDESYETDEEGSESSSGSGSGYSSSSSAAPAAATAGARPAPRSKAAPAVSSGRVAPGVKTTAHGGASPASAAAQRLAAARTGLAVEPSALESVLSSPSSPSSPSASPPRPGPSGASATVPTTPPRPGPIDEDEAMARALAATSPTFSSSSSSSSTPSSPSQSPRARAADLNEPPASAEENKARLVAMGFPEGSSEAALGAANGDLRRALSLLCQNGT